MNVEELFRQLSYGELSNLAVAVDGTGTIQAAQHPRVINFANDGLKAIYSRFLLSEKSELVTLVAGQTDYALTSTDVIRILAVYSAYGYELPIGEGRAQDALSTPSPKVLRVPKSVAEGLTTSPTTQLDVLYQSGHPKLVAAGDTTVILAQEILLDPSLHDALQCFIAWKMWDGLKTPDAQVAAAQLQAKYEAACNEVARLSLVSLGSTSNNSKFDQRGWI